jgi:hypothetical protein
MNARTKTFGSPEGEPSTTRSTAEQMCEKPWTLPKYTSSHLIVLILTLYRVSPIILNEHRDFHCSWTKS